LVEAKGVFELLDAYAKLEERARSDIGLVYVGDGNARSELEARASKLAPGTVRFGGFVQKEQLSLYYALADVLVFPTHSDTWGFVVNEAMACGLPVITTDVAGCASDLVKDGWNGLVVSVGNTTQLTDAMRYFILKNDLRSVMGERSLEQIAAFSPEAGAGGIARAAAAACGGPE